MKPRTGKQLRLLIAAFAGLSLLLAGMVLAGSRRTGAVRVGIPRTAAAYAAARLLQTPAAQYVCTLGASPEALAEALQAGELDAALLPRELALSMPDCTVRAAIGAQPLVILTRQEGFRLEKQTLTLDPALSGTDGERALLRALRSARLPCAVTAGEPCDPYVCEIDAAWKLLASDSGWRMALRLRDLWPKAQEERPPAGLCLVVRGDTLERAGQHIDALERDLRDAVRFSHEKRKKTAAMAAAAGLAANEEQADALYPLVDFHWLTGDDLASALYNSEIH